MFSLVLCSLCVRMCFVILSIKYYYYYYYYVADNQYFEFKNSYVLVHTQCEILHRDTVSEYRSCPHNLFHNLIQGCPTIDKWQAIIIFSLNWQASIQIASC